jgi:anti-sigma factor RsiW
MNYDEQLKVQAYLDGELPGKEAAEIERRLAQETEVRVNLIEQPLEAVVTVAGMTIDAFADLKHLFLE